ncbi:hypothetical protein [Huintestinicola sp.]|uniref:hypothetical protein n=1 Tax=Huintestinicola sp. TaxID=2981661 RepID=UPI003D7E8875
MTIVFVSRCQLCGKMGGKISTPSGKAPTSTPHVLGKCPASPTGNHAPRWEQE